MSNWLSKSKTSFTIANNEGKPLYYNNRVHCYYYGCVQYMFHILNTKLKLKIQEISDLSNPKLNPGNGGSHVWLQHYFAKNLDEKSFRLDGVDLNNHLGHLKKLRTSADYGHDDVDHADLENAQKLTTQIQTILIKRYSDEQP